ncbi:MAG: peptidylprolyl isomerase [Burkholderiales bacterium]|nr:peptidylprolyl isomerase [Burkholderiales bacterium]
MSLIRHLSRALIAAVSALAALAAQADTMVRLHTNQGPIDIQLFDSAAPLTVANFLAYVRSGAYTDSLVHRSVPGFVVQTGGYYWPATGSLTAIPARAPVANEYSAARSNVRGSVAMALAGSDKNSGTNQWFVNLADNNTGANNLDSQSFTVFGRITTPGMAVFDKIAGLTRVNAGSPFDTLPVINFVPPNVQRSNLVLVSAVTEFPARASQTESDRVFNYLEAAYPQYISPSHGDAGTALGYYYRYYSGSNAYAGTKDGQVWYLVPAISADIGRLGTLAEWLAIAANAGY